LIQLSQQSKILLAVTPVDFRRGIDGLCGLCRHQLAQDPRSGTIFCFINRSRTQLRILHFDGTGYWIMTKRLSQGCFPWWPKTADPIASCEVKRLIILLWGQNPDLTGDCGNWQKVS
jgi:transposase